MSREHHEGGFAMVAVIITMLVVTLLGVGAWSMAVGDMPLGRDSQDHKTALHAARAGIEWYTFELEKDPAIWSRCGAAADGSPAPSWLRPLWNGSGADPRTFRTIYGSTESYSVEMIPADGVSACSTSNPSGTMLQDGLLRIRSTGLVNGKKRSLIATYKRRGFLDYLYFTDYETLDPVAYGSYGSGYVSWAQSSCDVYYRDGRANTTYNGMHCVEIQFPTGDAVNGPMHTNDGLLVCGSPIFGRTGDAVEMSAPSPGYRANSGCSATPTIRGTKEAPAPTLDLPPSNSSLYALTTSPYRFVGKTTITLNGTNMTVTDQAGGTRTLPFPSNGVVYVSHNGCGTTYQLIQNYNAPAGCAEAWVKGTASQSLTIASEGDVVITDDVLSSNDALIGLIANQFVRVYHPVTNRSSDGFDSCTNATGGPGTITIQAAILALNHSFIVDNYYCGSPTGTLNITGALAQKFRGPVGTGGSSGASSGYVKNYNYDDRLHYREPPNFLDPVQTSWRLLRATEQVPAP